MYDELLAISTQPHTITKRGHQYVVLRTGHEKWLPLVGRELEVRANANWSTIAPADVQISEDVASSRMCFSASRTEFTQQLELVENQITLET